MWMAAIVVRRSAWLPRVARLRRLDEIVMDPRRIVTRT
jgi:hypothetical protein